MLNYKYLKKMTDNEGILQFAQNSLPDPQSGYTLDDNARALMVSVFSGNEDFSFSRPYIDYMYKAQLSNGSWANLLLNGCYIPAFDSEDSIGRALLACSIGMSSNNSRIRNICALMFKRSLPQAINFAYPRGISYTLLAICKCKLTINSEKSTREIILRLANALLNLYKNNHGHQWQWFEENMTYCNGIIPHALFSAYEITGNKKILKTAYESLSFLNSILFRDGYLNIIGNQGWYQKGKTIPLYDQQPVDAASIAFACWEAHKILGKNEFKDLALLASQWFKGKNILGVSLYDELSGGCFDALTPQGVNLNQGAESLLSLLLTEQLIEGLVYKETELNEYSV